MKNSFLWYKLGAKHHQIGHVDKQHFQQAQFIFSEYVFFFINSPSILVSKIYLHFTAEDCGRTAVMFCNLKMDLEIWHSVVL